MTGFIVENHISLQPSVGTEYAAANGECRYAPARHVPSAWIREEPGETAAVKATVHTKKGERVETCLLSGYHPAG